MSEHVCHRCGVDRGDLFLEVETLRAALTSACEVLERSRRKHAMECERWNDPVEDARAALQGFVCTCGADSHNAAIEDEIAKAKKAMGEP